MRKEALDDKYFIDNGYWVHSIEENRSNYQIIIATKKWHILMDKIFSKFGINNLITPDMIMKTIKDDDEFIKEKRKYYKPKLKPEGYLSTKELQAKKKKSRSIREARHKKNNDNRKSK